MLHGGVSVPRSVHCLHGKWQRGLYWFTGDGGGGEVFVYNKFYLHHYSSAELMPHFLHWNISAWREELLFQPVGRSFCVQCHQVTRSTKANQIFLSKGELNNKASLRWAMLVRFWNRQRSLLLIFQNLPRIPILFLICPPENLTSHSALGVALLPSNRTCAGHWLCFVPFHRIPSW